MSKGILIKPQVKDRVETITLPDSSWTQNSVIRDVTGTTTISDGTVNIRTAVFTQTFTEAGSYVFTYDGTNWNYDGAAVNLLSYGITYTGTPASGNTITAVLVVTARTNYTQSVFFDSITTTRTQVNVSCDRTTYVTLSDAEVSSLYIINDNGSFIAYCLNQKPGADITVQCALVETVEG